MTGRPLSVAEIEQRRKAAVRHGGTSERKIRPLARNHRRRLLRQIGLRAADVDPIGRAYLDAFVRLAAKVELIDRYVAEHGLLREDGEPQACMRLYVSLHNSARLALQRLELHLRATGRDPVEQLGSYLATTYGGNG
jgi:hypothetical protein